jgi:Branched-chain amino acid transport protein (AzlD)
MIWLVIAVLSILNAALKMSGPLILGERTPSERALRVISLVAPAVLTGLVVYESLAGRSGAAHPDMRLVGVGAAGAAISLRAPMTVVIVAAAAATAAARAVT